MLLEIQRTIISILLQVKYSTFLGTGHPFINDQAGSLQMGYGTNYPSEPHHRAASCQASPGPFDDSLGTPSPWILYGALVGGPSSRTDVFVNNRTDYVTNEVALDYNCGFQGLISGMVQLYTGNPPQSSTTTTTKTTTTTTTTTAPTTTTTTTPPATDPKTCPLGPDFDSTIKGHITH